MSKTVAVYPIVAALAQGLLTAKARTPFQPVNHEQERYLERFEQWKGELDKLTPEEMETIASLDADEINAFLAKKGFEIKLEPFEDPDDFGTASVMKVLVKWITEGKQTHLVKGDKEYPAAEVEEDIYFTQSPDYPHPVAHICTQSGDIVHMTLAADTSLEGLDLLAAVSSLTEGKRVYTHGSVIFPFVDHNAEVDISFFIDMFFKGVGVRTGTIGKYKVKQAKQQTKFAMNHIGAKAESAAAFGFGLECVSFSKPALVLNDTFYVWMTREGMSAPYFAGVIDESDWKDPGAIETAGQGPMQALPEPIEEHTEAFFGGEPEVMRVPRGRLEVI